MKLVQSAKTISTDIISYARLSLISQLIIEVMRDVPGADFIEIRAIRYDMEENDETRASSQQARPWPDPQAD